MLAESVASTVFSMLPMPAIGRAAAPHATEAVGVAAGAQGGAHGDSHSTRSVSRGAAQQLHRGFEICYKG